MVCPSDKPKDQKINKDLRENQVIRLCSWEEYIMQDRKEELGERSQPKTFLLSYKAQ